MCAHNGVSSDEHRRTRRRSQVEPGRPEQAVHDQSVSVRHPLSRGGIRCSGHSRCGRCRIDAPASGRPDTIVASADFVRVVDDIQYGLGQGPCITAAAEGITVRSGSLETDPQWPEFGPKVGRLGVHSVLSLPLITAGGVLGAMNVYAHRPDAFDARAAELGELFAVPAAISVQNARALASAARLTEQLERALNSRAVIDQAIGVLISRSGCTGTEGYDKLRSLSQSEHKKVAVVAESIVGEAMKAARSRSRR
ncbi:GAF and ANTAR domain-containing protein [Rhodococcus sp. SBT000017]|uniref:GAF and ANTAR domain-containing protein n=1 Tax=Rhodococcus sp. SBT000017 TaxID=1803385 RepID=UPI00217D32FF|nr:GAF and ANTAR domain-containing protein [Rhodococcus sp. SBT000017]